MARLAFPGGGRDMVDAWFADIDAAMEGRWPAEKLAALKIRQRIATLVETRIDLFAPDRESLRRALALLAFGLFRRDRAGSDVPGWLLLSGLFIFSTTLYAMALGGPRWLGAVTPIGGTLLVLGWAGFALCARGVRE